MSVGKPRRCEDKKQLRIILGGWCKLLSIVICLFNLIQQIHLIVTVQNNIFKNIPLLHLSDPFLEYIILNRDK
jgi:hypothetical protein